MGQKTKDRLYRLLIHPPGSKPEKVMLNLREFVDIKFGDVIEINQLPSLKNHLFVQIKPSNFDNFSKDVISVDKFLASAFNLKLQNETKVQVIGQFDIQGRCTNKDLILDHIEMIVANNLSKKSQIWRFINNLTSAVSLEVQKLLYQNQTIDFDENKNKVLIKNLFINKRPVKCGIISDNSKIVLRSRSLDIHILIHFSNEMWMYHPSGSLYMDRAIDCLFNSLMNKWRQDECCHLITVVLFSRLYFNSSNEISSVDEFSRFYHDFYKIICHRSDLNRVLTLNKIILQQFIEYKVHIQSVFSKFNPSLSDAYNGNIFESINISVDSIERFQQLKLNDAISYGCIIVVTCGYGLIESSKKLFEVTKARFLSNAISIDLISLCPIPPHNVPSIIYKYDDLTRNVEVKLINWIRHQFYYPRTLSLEDFYAASIPSPFICKNFIKFSSNHDFFNNIDYHLMDEMFSKGIFPFPFTNGVSHAWNSKKPNKPSSNKFWNRWSHVLLPSYSLKDFCSQENRLMFDNNTICDLSDSSWNHDAIDWLPLITPAFLPLSCDLNLNFDQLNNDYFISFYELFIGEKTKSIFIVNEMVAQRIDMGFQIVGNSSRLFIDQRNIDNLDFHIILADLGGKVIHVLIAQSEYVSVKIYNQKRATYSIDYSYDYNYTKFMIEYKSISTLVKTCFTFTNYKSTAFFNNIDRMIVCESTNSEFDENNQFNKKEFEFIIINQMAQQSFDDTVNSSGEVFNTYVLNLVDFLNKLNQVNISLQAYMQKDDNIPCYNIDQCFEKQDSGNAINYFIAIDAITFFQKELNLSNIKIKKYFDDLINREEVLPVNKDNENFIVGYFVYYFKPKRKLLSNLIEVEFDERCYQCTLNEISLQLKKLQNEISMPFSLNHHSLFNLGIFEIDQSEAVKSNNDKHISEAINYLEFTPILYYKQFFQLKFLCPFSTSSYSKTSFHQKINLVNQIALSSKLKLLPFYSLNHHEFQNQHHIFYFTKTLLFKHCVIVELYTNIFKDNNIEMISNELNTEIIKEFIRIYCVQALIDYLYENHFNFVLSRNALTFVHDFGCLNVEIRTLDDTLIIYTYNPWDFSSGFLTDIFEKCKRDNLMMEQFEKLWDFLDSNKIIHYISIKYQSNIETFFKNKCIR